jgi:hypothetical protein
MNKNILFVLLLILTCFHQSAFAQKKEYTIPFQLTEYNNLSIQAILNKRDTIQLMLHTAANALTLTEESVKKIQSLRFAGTADSVKSWGGSANGSRFSKNNTLQIGELQWDSLDLWEDKNSGQKTDGKFGPNLFANKAIAIDFDQKLITISTSIRKRIRHYEKLRLVFENDLMFVEAGCRAGAKSVTNRFLIHSGYAGAVLFDDKFAGENKFDEELKVIDVKELRDSFGNVVKVKKVILPTLTIGHHQLHDVPAGFFQGAIGRQKMSVLGGDILKRFNIIIDAQRAFIYLKTNSLKGLSYTG